MLYENFAVLTQLYVQAPTLLVKILIFQYKSIPYPTRTKGSFGYLISILGIILHPISLSNPVSREIFLRIPYPMAQKSHIPYPVKPYRGAQCKVQIMHLYNGQELRN